MCADGMRSTPLTDTRVRSSHASEGCKGRGGVGVLTTGSVKHAAMELFNMMLREKRVSICAFFHSREPQEIKIKLREQLEVYSFQYKEAANTFQKSRTALSGKIGGLKDDIAICLQLGCYWTSVGVLRTASLGLLGE